MICVILAAGKGTRMNSDIPKPLVLLHNRPMLGYLIDTVKKVGIKDIVLVLGHKGGEVKKVFKDYKYVLQKKQLGSGDAVNCARGCLKNYTGDILLLYADTPLIKEETILNLIKAHKEGKFGCTVLTAEVDNPKNYGRVIQNYDKSVRKIVEDKDATSEELLINEINVGAYVFNKKTLFENIDKIKINKKKNEYYLTDIINIFNESGIKVGSYLTDDISQGLGINSQKELAQANQIVKLRVLDKFMAGGVEISDPLSTCIDEDVSIGKNVVIYPNTIIEKNVKIGNNCKIGPMARIRSGTVIGNNVEIGNFVELNRSHIGDGCTMKHMTYLGDAVLGKNINIGAGTITANYDGKNKNKTIIGDNAFLGVGCILIAPVKVGKNSVIGAGSVVTKNHNVPDGKTVIGIPAKVLK